MKSELLSLEKMLPDVVSAIDTWVEKVGDRDDGKGVQISGHRQHLETQLTDFRKKMSTIYDFMGDRGLVNFEPTGFADELEHEDLTHQF